MGHHRSEAARIPNPRAKRGKPKRRQNSKCLWDKTWANLNRMKTGWKRKEPVLKKRKAGEW